MSREMLHEAMLELEDPTDDGGEQLRALVDNLSQEERGLLAWHAEEMTYRKVPVH